MMFFLASGIDLQKNSVEENTYLKKRTNPYEEDFVEKVSGKYQIILFPVDEFKFRIFLTFMKEESKKKVEKDFNMISYIKKDVVNQEAGFRKEKTDADLTVKHKELDKQFDGLFDGYSDDEDIEKKNQAEKRQLQELQAKEQRKEADRINQEKNKRNKLQNSFYISFNQIMMRIITLLSENDESVSIDCLVEQIDQTILNEAYQKKVEQFNHKEVLKKFKKCKNFTELVDLFEDYTQMKFAINRKDWFFYIDDLEFESLLLKDQKMFHVTKKVKQTQFNMKSLLKVTQKLHVQIVKNFRKLKGLSYENLKKEEIQNKEFIEILKYFSFYKKGKEITNLDEYYVIKSLKVYFKYLQKGCSLQIYEKKQDNFQIVKTRFLFETLMYNLIYNIKGINNEQEFPYSIEERKTDLEKIKHQAASQIGSGNRREQELKEISDNPYGKHCLEISDILQNKPKSTNN